MWRWLTVYWFVSTTLIYCTCLIVCRGQHIFPIISLHTVYDIMANNLAQKVKKCTLVLRPDSKHRTHTLDVELAVVQSSIRGPAQLRCRTGPTKAHDPDSQTWKVHRLFHYSTYSLAAWLNSPSKISASWIISSNYLTIFLRNIEYWNIKLSDAYYSNKCKKNVLVEVR